MGIRQLLMVLAAAGLATSCSNAVSTLDISKTQFQPDGSYTLTSEQISLDCQRLTNQANWHIDRMNWYANIETREKIEPPKTMISMFKKVFGSEKEVSENIKQMNKHRAQYEAFNKALAEKECTAVSFDENLSEHSRALLQST